MTDLELERLLRNARRVSARPGVKERLRGRVLSAAAAGGVLVSGAAHAGASVASTSVAVAGANTPLLWSAVLALAAGAAAGGLVTVPLVMLSPAAVSSSPARQRTEAPIVPRASHETPPQAAETEPPLAAVPSSLAEPKSPSALPRAVPSARLVPSIQRETLLLSEAQRALQQGDASAALGWLDRYDAEFPRGALSEEALAARGVTACSLGRSDLGRRALRTFQQTYPHSPLLPRLQAACRNLEEP